MCCAYILQVHTKTFQVVSVVIAEQSAIDVNDVWAGSKFTDLGADSFDTISKVNRHTF
jgi:acyl carrier protein